MFKNLDDGAVHNSYLFYWRALGYFQRQLKEDEQTIWMPVKQESITDTSCVIEKKGHNH